MKNCNRKILIAKRKKQFIALICSVIFALIPTTEVFANIDIRSDDLWDHPTTNPVETGTVKPGEKVTWGASTATGNQLVVYYRDNQGQNIKGPVEGNKLNEGDYPDRGKLSEVTIENCEIDDLDYWRYIDYSTLEVQNEPYKFIVYLEPVLKEKVNVTVKVNPNGSGTANASKDKVVKDENVRITAIARDGYEFDKWTTTSENLITIADTGVAQTTFTVNNIPENPNVGIEITANFKAKEPGPDENKINITFDYNGGKGNTASRTIEKGTSIGELPEATRDGYKLTGWFDDKTDGKEVTSATVFDDNATVFAQWKEDANPPKPGPDPDPKPSPDPDDDGKKKDKGKSGDSDSNEDNGKPVVFNPDAIDAHYFINNVLQPDAMIGKQKQSDLAEAVFATNLPKGWQKAFSMSMSVNGKNEYSKKEGNIVLYVPTQYQKAGREFAFLAMDKNGKVFVLSDQDKRPNIVTVTPNIEGYAYQLIFKD